MTNHEKTLLHGLILGKKIGYFERVCDAVQNGSIDINTLGIRMYDYGKEIDFNDYLLIIIELNNMIIDSRKYRIIRKFGECWYISAFLEEGELDQINKCIYSSEDEDVIRLIDTTTNMDKVVQGYTLMNIWYIPDFTNIITPENKHREVSKNLLLRGLSLSKKVGWYKDVYNSALDGSIDINELGIDVYDYKIKRNINNYSLIIIELCNYACDSYRYRFLKKLNNGWETTYWESEYDLTYPHIHESYKVDESGANKVLDDAVKIALNPNAHYRFEIWYIPDLSYIEHPRDENVNKEENIQKLLYDYNNLKKEISDETRKYTDRINEILKNQNVILDKILQYKGYPKNAKEKTKKVEEEFEKLCETYNTEHGLHHEVKYHIFDNFDLKTLIKYKKLNVFTEFDEFFYKWIEAQYRIGKFTNLYDILSKGLYHNPLKHSMFDNKTPEIGDSIIFLPKVPFDRMDKNVSAVKMEIITKNDIHIVWYDDYSDSITYVNYFGNYIMTLYDIFYTYPELKYCDEFYYRNVPDEDEIISKLKKVINI